MAPAVELRELSKHFGAFKAVDRVSLTVSEGEIFGFLGANGAGKSTTIRMLCGLLKPTSGTGLVLGTDVGSDPEGVKRKIGCMRPAVVNCGCSVSLRGTSAGGRSCVGSTGITPASGVPLNECGL